MPDDRTTPTRRYDGIRPRNAVCPACGYHISGVPIEHDTLTCPECGHVFVFAMPERSPARRRPGLNLLIWTLAVPGVALVAWRTTGSLLLAAAGAATMALVAVMLVRLRRLAVPDD